MKQQSAMVPDTLGIIMNGVTGRMGAQQHLLRSIVAIMQQGGVPLANGACVMPAPLLVGRNPDKLAQLAAQAGGVPWSTDLDAALSDPRYTVYFDAQTTDRRLASVSHAIAAGKHVYCEKPTALTTADALLLYQRAARAGVKHGVVQDKLWLPGLRKLKHLIDTGFFGRILSVRGEFGYWVFDGTSVAPQRPSWNYRKEDGGGIILDMFCHYRYVLDNLFGDVRAITCLGATHIPERRDEAGQPYHCTADDAAYATLELADGVIVQINSSWSTRVRRDDLFVLHVDGTQGSAVAGLRTCLTQPASATPRAVWNPDIEDPLDYFAGWTPCAPDQRYDNAFKVQWELFLRHLVANEPFPWNLLAGAKGVQLAELAYAAWQQRAWLPVPTLPEASA